MALSTLEAQTTAQSTGAAQARSSFRSLSPPLCPPVGMLTLSADARASSTALWAMSMSPMWPDRTDASCTACSSRKGSMAMLG